MNGMTWQDFVDSLREAGEPTPFKSKAQKRYKAQRKRNDIYSSPAGHKKLSSGSPFTTKAKRAGTDRLRFEEEVDPASFDTHDRLETRIWEGEELRPLIKEKLMKVAQDFLDRLPVEIDAEDIEFQVSMVENLVTARKFKTAFKNIDRIKKKIKNMRSAGLESPLREFSIENIAFKILRRNGTLQRLSELKTQIYDDMMTVKEE
jgi:hypothetical protein